MSGQGSVAASEVPPQSIHYLQVQTTTDSRAEAMELAREAVEDGSRRALRWPVPGEHVLVG